MSFKKRVLSFLVFCSLVVNYSFAQQPCDDSSIMIRKGTWKKQPDANMRPDKNMVQLTSRIDKISKLFQSACPEPKGMEAAWYRNMSASQLVPNGPTPYNFNSLYKSWYCNKYQHKMLLSDETGTWAYAFVNNLGWLISNQYDLLTIKINNNAVFILPPKKEEWKGYATYQSSSHGTRSRCIIVTHHHQLPWKAVTQEQYLQAVKKLWQDQKMKSAGSYIEQEENTRKGIAEIQNNKYLKAEDKEKIIAGMKKDLENIQKNKTSQISKSDKNWDDKIAVIDDYINQNKSELHQPAIIERKIMNDFFGQFSQLDKGGQMLVTIDPAYFNMKLPSYIPQLIVMYWKWDDNVPGLNFKKHLEENFPIEKLNEMIDK